MNIDIVSVCGQCDANSSTDAAVALFLTRVLLCQNKTRKCSRAVLVNELA